MKGSPAALVTGRLPPLDSPTSSKSDAASGVRAGPSLADIAAAQRKRGGDCSAKPAAKPPVTPGKTLANLAASAGLNSSGTLAAVPPQSGTRLADLVAKAGCGRKASVSPGSLLELAAKAKAHGMGLKSPNSAAAASGIGATGTLKVVLKCGVGLKPADSNGLSDPYVVLETGGGKAQKSSTVYKSLNPTWDETFAFTGPLDDFLRTGLELRVWDKDKFSRDDALGKAKLQLTEMRWKVQHDYEVANTHRRQPSPQPPPSTLPRPPLFPVLASRSPSPPG